MKLRMKEEHLVLFQLEKLEKKIDSLIHSLSLDRLEIKKELNKPTIITTKEVMRLTTFSRSTIWRMERARIFPSSRKISANRVGWVKTEVEEFLSRIARRY